MNSSARNHRTGRPQRHLPRRLRRRRELRKSREPRPLREAHLPLTRPPGTDRRHARTGAPSRTSCAPAFIPANICHTPVARSASKSICARSASHPSAASLRDPPTRPPSTGPSHRESHRLPRQDRHPPRHRGWRNLELIRPRRPQTVTAGGRNSGDRRPERIGGDDPCLVEELLQRLGPVTPAELDLGGRHRQRPQDASVSPQEVGSAQARVRGDRAG